MHERYVMFSLQDASYAVQASAVLEILWMPELTPCAEAPACLAGLVNFRGNILPVIDIMICLGRSPAPYSIEDYLIILGQEGQQAGIIVNQVHDVSLLPGSAIEPPAGLARHRETHRPFITSVAQVGNAVVMLLDHMALMRAAEEWELAAGEAVLRLAATPEERAVLRQRAQRLRQSPEEQSATGLIPLAVVGLNGEYFGVELATVREFADLQKITPVPCCLDHIVGDMNLRGDILTVVDIRRALQMPLGKVEPGAKVIVVQMEDALVGVLVDRVLDVLYLCPADAMPIPPTAKATSGDYLTGAVPYAGKMLSILNLSTMLRSDHLSTNEEA